MRHRTSDDGDWHIAARFWSKVAVTKSSTPCWEWQRARTANGYGKLRLSWAPDQMAHRVAWILANGPIPSGLWVLHLCDNPPCCNPQHLYLGTHQDNMRDVAQRKTRLARQPRGMGQRRRRLTAQEVRQIRALRDALSVKVLAKQFGVASITIERIVSGRAWKHVK